MDTVAVGLVITLPQPLSNKASRMTGHEREKVDDFKRIEWRRRCAPKKRRGLVESGGNVKRRAAVGKVAFCKGHDIVVEK